MLTGYGSIATAVKAVQDGAFNYLTKPIGFELLEATLLGKLNTKDIETKGISSLSRHEHEYIEFVLTKNDGNISKSARELGLHRQSLQRKRRKFP